MNKKIKLLRVSRGIGQVMFQNNALSGALMLMGILFNSWQLALLAVLGNAVSTGAAAVCKYNLEDINNGLYGFNGTLVGIAIGVFMEITWLSLLLLIIFSALSTWIARLFRLQSSLPGLTAPFVLSIWLALLVSNWFYPNLLLAKSSANIALEPDLLAAFTLDIGQVMFQENTIWTGIIFLLAIAINSRINAIYVVLGSSLSILIAIITGIDNAMINAGLVGYNAVLCAVALGGKSIQSGLWAVSAVVLSIVLQWLGINWGITTLTAPFVVSVWIIMHCRYVFNRFWRNRAYTTEYRV